MTRQLSCKLILGFPSFVQNAFHKVTGVGPAEFAGISFRFYTCWKKSSFCVMRKKMSPKYPIDYALEYIHCNYNLGLTLEGISKYVGVNRTTLNENCKRKTGMTIIQYLNHYRITMAQEALKHTNLKLSEIAVCCGYNYESYFVKSFTEKQGISPNEYRKKYRG